MPAIKWPGTLQMSKYLPGFNSTDNEPDLPAGNSETSPMLVNFFSSAFDTLASSGKGFVGSSTETTIISCWNACEKFVAWNSILPVFTSVISARSAIMSCFIMAAPVMLAPLITEGSINPTWTICGVVSARAGAMSASRAAKANSWVFNVSFLFSKKPWRLVALELWQLADKCVH